MSRCVCWGYAPGSALELLYTLGPYEAFLIVMKIDSSEDVRRRAFVSTISVNAKIGRHNQLQHCKRRSNVEEEAELMDSDTDGGDEGIVVAADAHWTSGRVRVENSDAFCVDMSLRGNPPSWVVGAPLVVSLRVLNLSMEPRDLMLLMAKDGEGGKDDSGLQWEQTMGGQEDKEEGRM